MSFNKTWNKYLYLPQKTKRSRETSRGGGTSGEGTLPVRGSYLASRLVEVGWWRMFRCYKMLASSTTENPAPNHDIQQDMM